MSTLSTMTIKELVTLHNDHADAENQIKTFKGRKDDLISSVSKIIRASRGTTIKDFADALLIEVAEVKDGQKIGHPYDYVLDAILEEFPEANTTVKCLRWYNTKLNSDTNVRMPIRPRKKAVKAEVVEAPAPTKAEAPKELVADPLA